MKYPGKKKSARTGMRVSLPLLILVLAIVTSVLIIYSTPVLTSEKRTSGNLTFTDAAGDQISGTIEISMIGAPPGRKDNVNSITWNNAPNAWIYFDAHETKSVSMNLRISEDSPSGVVSLDDFGAALPGSVAMPAPGTPVKYVELHSSGVAFTDADISIYYTDAEIGELDEKSLVIYSYDGGAWNELTSKVDASDNVVSATVNSLSIFAISTHADGEIVVIETRKKPVTSSQVSGEIVILDTKNKPVISHVKTYDKDKTLKKAVDTDTLSQNDIPETGEIEFDALDSKNVAVKLKVDSANGGEILLDDYGKNNPVSTPLPGNTLKYVEIHANNISYSSAEVRIKYSEDELDGINENKLIIYHWNGGAWEALATQVDTQNNIISASTNSLSVFGAAMPGSAVQIRVFTDKHVYNDDPYDMDLLKSWGENNKNLLVIIYAIVMDEDGNMLHNFTNTNFSGRLKDVHLLDHWDGTAATTAVHEVLDPAGYYTGRFYNISIGNGTSFTFVDNGTGNDRTANDGIYTTTVDVSELPNNIVAGNWSSGISEEHLDINVTVSLGSINDTASLLFSRYACMHGTKAFTIGNSHGQHEGTACTLCHHGYEHHLGDHYDLMTPTSHTGASKNGVTYAWNTSASDGFGGANPGTRLDTDTTTWSVLAPGSEYCYSCHWDQAETFSGNNKILDMETDSTTDRTSCSWSSSPAGVVCHNSGRTNRTNSSLSGVDWKWKLNGATGSKYHNYTGNAPGIPCENCHGTVHDNSLPNKTTKLINSQCFYCHNDSRGVLNITSNGGTGINHTSSVCSNCHLNENRALDPHNMPIAQWPNGSCIACHESGGRAPKHVDVSSMNVSTYVHYNLNNLSNYSGSGRWENRLCWACHGEDDNYNNISNYSEQPNSSHPTNYFTPFNCEDCHRYPLIAGGNRGKFNAPIRFGHTSYGVINVTANISCSDCHSQIEMNANFLDGEGNSNSISAHYGKKRLDLRVTIGNVTYCGYCHQNASTPFPFSNTANKARPNHSIKATTPSCGNAICHGPYDLHNENLSEPTYDDSDCLICHSSYQKHHTTIQCMNCHMNNTQTNIHPITYFQTDGITFSISNLTAITCHNCHMDNVADNTMNYLAPSYPIIKVKSKHGSNVSNGSIWGNYWNNTPQFVTTVTNYSINGNGTVTNFNNSKSLNSTYSTITETNRGSFRGNFPTNQNFTYNFTNSTGWTATSQANIYTGYDPTYGTPTQDGAIYTEVNEKSTSGYSIWNSSFVYTKVSTVADAELDFNVRVATFSSYDPAGTNNYVIEVVRPNGSTVTIFPTTQISGVYSNWKQFNYSISNPNTVFSSSGTYTLQIKTTLSSIGSNVRYVDLKVYFDNVRLLINEVDYNRFDVNYSIDNVTGINITTGNYTLGLGYQAAIEPVNLYIYNGTAWNYKTSLNSTAMTMYYTQLTQQQYNNSFVKVRFNDSNWGVDTTTDSFYVSTLYVFSDTNKQYSCEYCHDFDKHFGNALGAPEYYNGTNIVHQSITESTGTWCASCHYQGYSSGSDSYNDMVSEMLSRGLPVPPEITGNATYAPITSSHYQNHNLGNYYDSTCFVCHGGSLNTSAGMAEFMHNLTISPSGGRNCIACHNLATGLTNGATSGINFTAFNQSSHVRMNNANATTQGYAGVVGACWACHSSNGNLTSDMHPDRQKVPKTCTECHLGTGTYNASQFNAIVVSEHYYGGSDLKAGNSSSNISSCINCHENVSEMILYNNDTDTATSFTGDGVRLVGGNMSYYHYGNNRTALRQGTSVNCSYCHQNASTAFASAMIDPSYNKSISNHSQAYSSSNPGCTSTQCHSTGRMHNSTLNKPVFALPNSSYCTSSSCHGTGGSATYNNRSKHNNSVNCTQCHLNSSRSIHPARYLQNINNTWNTSKTNAVNCTNCHQNSTFWSGAPIIPSTVKHSSNTSNGSIWNNTATRYWSGQDSSCYYCHNNTKHNSTGMGSINSLLSSINTGNSALTTTRWCADCHYNTSNPTYKGNLSQWSPTPPLITIDNTGKSEWQDHSGYLGSGYNDTDCKICHALNGSGTYLVTSRNYSHSLDPGVVGGGPNCITCHNLVTGLSGGAPSGINFTAANASSHNGTNSNNATQRGFAPVVGACWACHDSDGNVTSGHPDRYKTPKTCTECHLGTGTYNASAYNATIVSEHFYGGSEITAGNSTSNISSCINCHENVSEMVRYNNDTDYATSFTGDGIRLVGGNMSFYHYGADRSDLRTWNGSAAANCSYCHQNASTAFSLMMVNSSYNRSISNHSTGYDSSNPSCISTQCHGSGWIHNSSLSKPAISIPNSSYCLSCHGNNGSGITNYTGSVTGIKDKHNNSLDCSQCHLNTTKSIHPVRYLKQDGSNWSTSNSSSVNCTNCHQGTGLTNFSTAPNIPSPMYHSNNASNGTIWGSYWTSNNSLTACIYCHSDTKHNATALGRPNDWKGNNTVNSSLNVSTWCSSCHYKNYSNYSNMTQAFTSAGLQVPPEITNGTYASSIYNRSNYYNHSLTGYNDSTCRLCHGVNLSSSITTGEFIHNMTGATGATCTDCHYSFNVMNNTTKPEMYVDQGMYNTSLHRSLTCSNCHTQGHRNIGARKACEDCHVVQADPINDKDRHNITSTPSTYFYNSVNVVNITTCTTCHKGTLYNTSIATYGYWKQKDCDYCHTYPDKYYE